MVFLSVVCAGAPRGAEARTWTDDTGKNRVEEDFVNHLATYADRDLERVQGNLQALLGSHANIWACKECKEHPSLPTVRCFSKGIKL